MSESGETYDLVVIGGGINGAGIAADASQRGLSVLLAEAGDLAGGTSSASSKLIHGGLRYLEHYEFRLVREALREREVLLEIAPHIIWPLRFLLPYVRGMRPAPLIRAGLFLYDHLAARKILAGSRSVDLQAEAPTVLRPQFNRGFSYYDCWVDDARLVVLNAIAARERGAEILTRTPVTDVAAHATGWLVVLGARTVRARAIVNATGPSVSHIAQMIAKGGGANAPSVRLVKGSHIVVPRITGATEAFIFQNGDGRVVFALPMLDKFTLIGTTEVSQQSSTPEAVTEEEMNYLLGVAKTYFRNPPSASDIVWRFAGVRPLVDDGSASASAVSRDYRLELDTRRSQPVLHVIGGKITTYRKLAEAALEKLAPHLPPMRDGRTAATPLPGGEMDGLRFADWFANFASARPGFSKDALMRLARRYGSRAAAIVHENATESDLGPEVAAGLSEREIEYLKRKEWATAAEDVLWRRTKAGLYLTGTERMRAADAIETVLNRV